MKNAEAAHFLYKKRTYKLLKFKFKVKRVEGREDRRFGGAEKVPLQHLRMVCPLSGRPVKDRRYLSSTSKLSVHVPSPCLFQGATDGRFGGVGKEMSVLDQIVRRDQK